MPNANPRPGHLRPVLAAALAAASLCALAPSTALAHFILVSPSCLSEQNGIGDPQKAPPCGAGKATNKVTTYRPGDTISITIDEKVPHPGHYRVLLAKDQASLPDDPKVTAAGTPCGSTVIDPNPKLPLLADGLLVHTQAFAGPQTMQVKLPANMTCNNCVLQVVEFMSNHALNNPGGCFYHHCATITIEPAAVNDGGVSDGGGKDGSAAADLSDNPDLSVVTEPPAPGGCAVTQRPTAGAPTLALLALALGLALRRRRAS